ncbi:MAG: hypothetical protein IK077_13525 [Thermoguttaceae bacterium]|nr:hypothetical protein [Thermoguttaceae bacterium]
MENRFTTLAAFALLAMASAFVHGADGVRDDWLLNPTPYVSEIRFDKTSRELTLTNGLIERRLALFPEAATLSLRNLRTGEEFVRALSPEGRVTVDGETYPIGGLTSGPVANYWKEEWKADAKPLRNAYRFERWEVGEIEERFPYKQRPEWLSKDVQWPPKGKRVNLFFQPPDVVLPPDRGATLFEDSFVDSFDSSWSQRVSDKAPRVSLSNEGKAGEIAAPGPVCAYIERRWEPGAVAAQFVLDLGTERGENSWGPGAAVVCDDKIVSVVACAGSLKYAVCVDGVESLSGSLQREREIELTFRLVKSPEGSAAPFVLTYEARQPGVEPVELGAVEVSSEPSLVRFGKVGRGGYGNDYVKEKLPENVSYSRVHLKRAAFYAPVPEDVAEKRNELPTVEIQYEIYDGAPLISKKMIVSCPKSLGDREFLINSFVNEELRLVEPESFIEYKPFDEPFNIAVLSDYNFRGYNPLNLMSNPAYRMKIDPDYPTQICYQRNMPCLLECSPELGPAQFVNADKKFESNTIFEILYDNTERERRGLALRRAMRILAPWTAENPLMFHKVRSTPEEVRNGIEQCRETGFEILIMSFGSDFNLEKNDPDYRETYRRLSLEAKQSGIALGGYSLTWSRGAETDADNVHNPRPTFGKGPCLQSTWGQSYLQSLKDFMEYAEFGVFENDGPYPGDFCEATDHPGHRGKEDSVWTIRKAQADLYRWCRAHGVYVNQPDGYFLEGANKTDMMYRESNGSLPRAEQVVIERQNIYDSTWDRSQTMGWTLVPLSQYQGGGAAATIEPLKEHLDHYDSRLANHIGSGTQSCWRGPRLYDCEETKTVVLKWVNFYKENRRILDSDLIHLRRPTGRDWDGWLHVDPDPNAKTRGMAFLYNPTQDIIKRRIVVPLYYTGLKDKARVRLGNSDLQLGEPFDVELDGAGETLVDVEIPAESYAWITFEEAK